MKHVFENLYWSEETCSVYGLKVGEQWLFIDCGNRREPVVPDGRVDKLLLTHFHRDQCAAAPTWQRQGVEVVLPFAEKRFFEEGDLLRASYDTHDNYTSYFPGFGPLDDLRGTYAVDYEKIYWAGLEIEVVPLPGHTFGSVGYLFELAGQRVLACGDLLSAPGKLREYFWSQWRYMDFQGHVNHMESLVRVAGLGVDLILPGHGAPFAATPQALAGLQQAMEELWELFYGRPYEHYQPQFRQLSPHLIEVVNSAANTYIVRDDEGHALFIDCGYTSNAPIGANPHRFIDHLTPHLEKELGVREVEWFIPSHYHDDHLAGLPALQNRYNTKVATSPELKDILEHPERFDMPCLVPEGTEVAQVVERGRPFEWRGGDFFIEQYPGQTLYHHLVSFALDGQKFLSIGDNISGLSFAQERDFIHSFIPKNRTPVSSYGDMPRQILERRPDWLLTGHGGAVACEQGKVERWQEWMDRWEELFVQIIDQPHPDMGMDPHWVEFYPYKVRIEPGEERNFEIRIKNHECQRRKCTLQLRVSGGAELEVEKIELEVAAGALARTQVQVRFPDHFTTHSLTLVADVMWNGRSLGEIAEAVAYW